MTSLGRVQNTAIAVGNFDSRKVEALENGTWNELADFPFSDYNMKDYSTVTFRDSMYLFGNCGIIFPNKS